jgi:negative regulator of flagellin synthesis FlgM
MDIRNSVDGLKTLLGVPSTAPVQTPQVKSGPATGVAPLAGDHATLSTAGTEVSQTASDSGVRADKVASVQAALAAGTYNVPASAVAGKVVDSMLGGQFSGE